MENLTYKQIYESCRKDISSILKVTLNLDHFKSCMRNIEEPDLELIFHSLATCDATRITQTILDILTIESEKRIDRIATQNAKALMEDLS